MQKPPMTGPRRPRFRRWRLRYAFCVLLITAAAFLALRGGNIYLSLGIGVVGVWGLVGWGRVLFGTGVTHDGEVIVCRYVPWLEGTIYGVPMWLLFGVSAIGLSDEPGFPPHSGYIGWAMVALTPLGVFGFTRARVLSLLRITPEMITVQGPGRPYPSQVFRSQPIDIPRGSLQEVTSKSTPVAGLIAHEVQITYRAIDSEAPKTWVFGPPSPCQLTVEPSNLRMALQVWKDANPDDPGLMARLEHILSSRTPVEE